MVGVDWIKERSGKWEKESFNVGVGLRTADLDGRGEGEGREEREGRGGRWGGGWVQALPSAIGILSWASEAPHSASSVANNNSITSTLERRRRRARVRGRAHSTLTSLPVWARPESCGWVNECMCKERVQEVEPSIAKVSWEDMGIGNGDESWDKGRRRSTFRAGSRRARALAASGRTWCSREPPRRLRAHNKPCYIYEVFYCFIEWWKCKCECPREANEVIIRTQTQTNDDDRV